MKIENFKLKIISPILYLVIVSWCLIIASSEANAGTIIKAPAYLSLQTGLVGNWTLDGADIGLSGTIAKDISGNNNNATLIGGPTLKAGKIGQAMGFGSTKCAEAPASTTLNDLGPLTASFWYRIDNNSWGNRIMLAKRTSSPGTGRWWIEAGSTNLRFTFVKAGTTNLNRVSATGTVVIGEWAHFVLTWSGGTEASTINMYINGSELAYNSGQNGASLDSDVTNNFVIGAMDGGADCSSGWSGDMDDVRLYKRVLSTNEIQRLYRIGLGSTFNRSSTSSSSTKGLIGHWSFDGTDFGPSGTTAKDRSGQGNNGTLTNGPTKVQGKIGQALSFNSAASQYVNLGASNIYTPSGTGATLSAWVNATGSQTVPKIAAFLRGASSTGFGILTDNLNFHVYYRDSVNALTQLNSGTTVRDGSWHHVTAVINGTTITAFVDGISRASATNVDTANTFAFSSNVANIAATEGASNFFNGQIDDVRFYNRALSASEIKNLYQETQSKFNVSKTDSLTRGLVGCWTFDGAYNKAPDCSGNNNTGTLTGGPTKAQGKIGQALSFDGVDDYVDVGDPSSDILDFGTATDFTISAWLNTPQSSIPSIVGKRDIAGGTPTGYSLRAIATLLRMNLVNSANQSCSVRGSINVTTGGWKHVVGVARRNASCTTSDIELYVDGVRDSNTAVDSSSTNANTSISNSHSLLVGAIKSSGVVDLFTLGSLDEVRIYNRALSSGEINKLYQMGR